MNDFNAPPRPTTFAVNSDPALPSSEIIKKKISRTATVSDELGRVIVIKYLGPLDRMRLVKLVGQDAKNEIYMGYAVLASAVSKIDDDDVSVSTLREIEFLVERLGDEGLNAVGEGYQKNFGALLKVADMDVAKN
jgi:hypothetical protein